MKRLRRTSGPIRADWNRAESARSIDEFDRTVVRLQPLSGNWEEARSRIYCQSRKSVLGGVDVEILDFVCEIARYMSVAGLTTQTLARAES
jgi:hypothetical protein